jgi:prephenate dehydrogenase
MAGKEQRGAQAADGTLFRNRPYVLTPFAEMTPKMFELQSWLLRLESRIIVMSATEHDNVVALTSHLPQLLSTAISVTLAERANSRLLEVFGPGLLDMTRLAMSSPDVWKSVLDTNRTQIVNALGEFTNNLRALAEILEAGSDLDHLFTIGREFALRIRKTVS